MTTNQTFYDSAEIQTDVKTQYNQQSLFVPIRDLVDGLKVNGTWDQKRHALGKERS
ncbi:hypothetical protein KP014_25600 [Paenibacillus sophorae]|uniref:Copper amine oxidase N-terminal domain-containing protein n=1 Tax=Paenibacillus sophorae TaxID=1333845 RepID=A0ABX8HL16_9BACL|nr:hypothetical protein KP014_25600 [Paenibacillus sophorae]